MAINFDLMQTSPNLQGIFRDKVTGEPLANGKVFFFQDEARTILKPVFKITGAPPSYTFTALPNPLILNAIGTYTDTFNNDIIIYFFPFDDDGEVEKYFIKVEDENGVEQFTREGWPQFAIEGSQGGDADDNFIVNGQFLLNSTPPGNPTLLPPLPDGSITKVVTPVAYGNWTYEVEVPAPPVSPDVISFPEDLDFVVTPPGNPRHRFRVTTEVSIASASRDLRIKFDNVHRFASTTTFYTFSFFGRSETGASTVVDLLLIKNFGPIVDGGDPQTTTPLTSFTLSPGDQKFTFAFILGSNAGKNVATTGGDFIQIALRFPVGSAFDVSLTDVFFLEGDKQGFEYPTTTDLQYKYRSVAGGFPIPATNGNDLYLPIRLTPTGLEYDQSEVGKVHPVVYETVDDPLFLLRPGELLCDGAEYETTLTSSDGIPFSRLQKILFNQTTQIPIFGTGVPYFTNFASTTTSSLIYNNEPAVVTDAVDVSSTVTFRTVHKNSTGFFNYDINAYLRIDNELMMHGQQIGSTCGIGDVNSGFSFIDQVNSPLTKARYLIQTVAAAGLAGKSFLFCSIDNLTVNNQYYVWFTVAGIGADPVGVGRSIKVELETADTAVIVAQKVMVAVNAFQATYATFPAAAAIGAGTYFEINSSTVGYYVWYEVDGAGTDPAPAGRVGIKVSILSADTAVLVASKTQLVMNSRFFATPDLRGVFIRGWNDGRGRDPGNFDTFAAGRVSSIMTPGDILGNFQFDNNQQHIHLVDTFSTPASGGDIASSAGGGTANISQVVATGFAESTPINVSLNYVIKY